MFQVRHAKCEQKEKNRYLNFIGGNNSTHNRKRLRPKRSSTPEPSNNHHGSSVNLDHDCEMFLQVLPFPPRKFPLVQKELLALDKPGPPPKRIAKYVPLFDIRYSSSPSPISYNEKSQTPFGQTSSPLSSPLTRVSTPPEVMSSESPLSTSKWTVVNGNAAAALPNQQCSGLVLKLSKRI